MSDAFPSVVTAVAALHFRAERTPERLAYTVGGASMAYGPLRERALATAAALADRGLARGDRCALVLPTSLDFIQTLCAVQLAGATPVALNPALPASALARRIASLRCRLVVATVAHAGPVAAALSGYGPGSGGATIVAVDAVTAAASAAGFRPPAVAPDDLAYIQVTSGTTGEPRGVMISHESLTASRRSAMAYLEMSEHDVLVSWLPLHHDLGLVHFVFGPLYFGCPCHLVQPSILNLEEWLRTASRVRATITASPDFGYRIAARMVPPAGLDLSSLKAAINGGEPVRLGTIEAFERRFGLGRVVRPAYGLAEATLGVAFTPIGDPLRIDAAGQVASGRGIPGVDVRIVDAEGQPRPPGERGEIVVRGPTVFAGYFDDASATAEVLRDGWLHTGDEGFVDADGYVYVLGRRRTMIKVAGTTVAPREAEEAADGSPAVRFSAAIGLPDARTETDGLVVVAEVRPEVAGTPAAHSDLARDLARRVQAAIGLRPARVLLVAPRAIPITHNGKTRHGELRRQLESGTFDRGAILHDH